MSDTPDLTTLESVKKWLIAVDEAYLIHIETGIFTEFARSIPSTCLRIAENERLRREFENCEGASSDLWESQVEHYLRGAIDDDA
jgi:hypothetical protein